MKKLNSKQHRETLEEEVKRLRKENKKLSSKNDKQKDVIGKLRKDLKKKDVPTITMTDEQRALLLSLFPDIDTLF